MGWAYCAGAAWIDGTTVGLFSSLQAQALNGALHGGSKRLKYKQY
jgi:hypothetical protein